MYIIIIIIISIVIIKIIIVIIINISSSSSSSLQGFMLARMTTEQKFAACSRIATTVLSAFAAGEGALRLPKREKSPAGQV